MNSVRRFVLALLLALGLVAAPVAAGGLATAAPNPCIAQEGALAAVNARAAAHNAHWTPTKPQAEAYAYNAEAAEINSEGSFAQSALEACYLQNGINKPIPRTPLGPPNQRPSNPAPPRPQPRSVPTPQRGPQSSPTNPTPSYPNPKPINNPAVTQDKLYDSLIPGSRVTQFQDGGRTVLNPMINRAATGQTSYVTPDMMRGGGTQANPNINPPGWDPSRAWGPGRYGPNALQRLHLLPRAASGSGDDARNLITGTKAANDAMQVIESKVIAAARGGEAVWYNVTPIYGNGYATAPTQIIVGAVGVRTGVIDFKIIPNIP